MTFLIQILEYIFQISLKQADSVYISEAWWFSWQQIRFQLADIAYYSKLYLTTEEIA